MGCWIYYQPNKLDKGDISSDCVIRCLCKLLNKKWLDIFDELYIKARVKQRMPNDGEIVEEYLTEHNFNSHKVKRVGHKLPTVKQFAKDCPNGKFLVWCHSHIVAVCNGKIYDSWDSSNERVYEVWCSKTNKNNLRSMIEKGWVK